MSLDARRRILDKLLEGEEFTAAELSALLDINVSTVRSELLALLAVGAVERRKFANLAIYRGVQR